VPCASQNITKHRGVGSECDHVETRGVKCLLSFCFAEDEDRGLGSGEEGPNEESDKKKRMGVA